ncbi:MAG: YlcI/YnfO family protein [Gallionella sp.]
MKTATMPALRVHPELRQAAEEILRPGETLSGFVEDALRRNVELRRAQQTFIARGLASRETAKQNDEYVPAGQVLRKLAARLEKASVKSPTKKTRVRTTRGK